MEIVTQQLADALEVKVKGRLDNYWGEHLQRNLEQLIRGGAHHLRLNFSGVSYLSSAGVGLLVRFNRERGITILMVTHEPDMASYASRTIKFRDGQVDSDERTH